ncbi:hypothetical protein [Bacillus sp. FJAT-27245]|uniref:hypothetical protein n=1 Tax=Bacillus sp. FJAT-27245 TaxID=1684144 RepID=UPI0006A77863|nr:hypothetical protein [Bacillus sp. FJAT-27245]
MPNLRGDQPAKASFEALFLEKTTFGWKQTFDRGATSGTLERNLYSQYLSKYSSKSPFPMLFGEITNPRIEKVKIEYGNGQKVIEPKIVTKNDKTFWFVFVEEPKEKETYIIKGFTADGELIETVTQESEQ